MAFERLGEAVTQRRQQQLFRQREVLAQGNDSVLWLDKQPYLNFSSNDYLGLAREPRVQRAAADGALKYGVGSGGSALISGFSQPHQRLESILCELTGLSGVLLFSSGFAANTGVISGLLAKGDLLLQDKLNHASLIDAGRVSPATMKRFLHNDVTSLHRLLSTKRQGDALIATEGVFSMDGDAAPLADIAAAARQHDAYLMVDDAHGFGIFTGGRGSCDEAGITPDLLMATFGKALGTSGAFVAADSMVIEYLVNFCRHYIYTTAISPAMAAATIESLALAQQQPWRQEKLAELIDLFKAGMTRIGLTLLPSKSPIQPLMVGSPERALQLAARLRARGIWLTAIRPPTVPQGSSRLRITLSASHNRESVTSLIDALEQECCRD